MKWDGIRAIAYYEPGRFRLESRNLNDITAQYPELRRLGRQLGSRDAVLDGEIVAFDERGRPSFERLQQRMHLTRDAEIRRRAQEVPVAYMLFDVLYLEGHSQMARPYEERREVLESMKLEGAAWQTPRYHRGQGAALLEASARQGLEGVVAKRLDSRYAPGQRSSSWIKVKNKQRQVLVIGGWLPEKERADRLGALLVGVLRRAGKVPLRAAASGRGGMPRSARGWSGCWPRWRGSARRSRASAAPAGARYVEPRLVAEIEFTEWTNEQDAAPSLVQGAGRHRARGGGAGRTRHIRVRSSQSAVAGWRPRRRRPSSTVPRRRPR